MNRRPYRPNRSDISEFKDRSKVIEAVKPPMPPLPPAPPPQQQQQQSQPPHMKKAHPPTDTFAENYYYLKQMGKKTPMAVVFQDGEILEGYVEWYDRNCIKLNRNGAPNLLVYKNALKYIYKLDEGKESSEEEGESEGK